MTTKKLTTPDVYKKDLKVLMFLFIFGGATFVSKEIGANDTLSVLIGGATNYVAYRAMQEAQGKGYLRSIRGK